MIWDPLKDVDLFAPIHTLCINRMLPGFLFIIFCSFPCCRTISSYSTPSQPPFNLLALIYYRLGSQIAMCTKIMAKVTGNRL